MSNSTKTILLASARALLLGLVLNGTVTTWVAAEEPAGEQPLFFPGPPAEPRLQFLATFSSPLDVSTKSKGFRDFVFGGEDKEAKLVEKPYGLALYEGAIFVVDSRGNGYGIFDVVNSRSKFVRPTGAGSLDKPINIEIDDDGTRYITDTYRKQVLVFNSNDRFVRAIGRSGQFKPVDIAIIGDRLYVSDVENHQIHVIDKTTDDLLFSFGEAGSEPGQLFHPTHLAIGPDNTVYVTDTSNFRLQQFTADGEFIRTIGTQGVNAGTFLRPKGIAVNKEDYIYVLDAAFQNIQVLGPDGGAVFVFGGPGRERASINLPTEIIVDYDNVTHFQKYAAPNFDIEYIVAVASQYGSNKVVVFGYGELID
jgi:DNA-binding beta-propeller fold protein YncE